MKKKLFSFLLLSTFIALPAFARVPNDPHVLQWAYEDTGVYRAWDTAQGSRNVVVAVVDNGFDMFHPDLLNNVWKNEDEIPDNGIDDDENGYIDDVWGWNFVPEDANDSGGIDADEARGNNDPRPKPEDGASDGIIHHGTVVAGLVGAVGNNGLDGVGVNWRVRLMNIKVLDNTGRGNFVSLGDALRYAVDNGADIINLSVVGNTNDDLEAAIDYAHERGVVIVAAAGNDNIDLNVFERYPICSDVGEAPEKIIGVTAITEVHRITFFSNIGSNCVDLTAPGENVSSTLRFSPTNDLSERYGGGWGGTSFAAPLVSGTAALLKSIHPEWGPSEIYEAIISTVHHTPGQDEEVYANLFGAGLLQVDKALAYAKEIISPVFGRVISGVLSIDAERGAVYEHDSDSGESDELLRTSALVNIDDVIQYSTGDASRFVVVKHRDNQTRRVTVYTDGWALLQSWDIDAAGPVQIAVGDVFGGDAPEIVIADQYQTNTLFRVYSLFGERLYEHGVDESLSGVSITLRPRGEGEKSDIVTLSKERDNVIVRRLSGDGVESQRFVADGLRERGAIQVADIDGDGTPEYAVGAGAGETAFLLYYTAEGNILRKFWAYADGYLGGFSMAVSDYDGDGKDDLILGPNDGSRPVRVWNYRSQKLAEWWPFGEEQKIPAHIVPVFKH